MTDRPKVWAIRAAEGSIKGKAEKFARKFWNERVAAIDYLGNGGPDLRCSALSELKDTLRAAGYENKSRIGNVAKQLWRFANEIRTDDWIVVPRPKPGDVMIGLCASTYQYAPGKLDDDEYPYVIGVDWLREISRECLSEDLRGSIEGHNGQSLWRIEGSHIPELESLCKLGLEYRKIPVNLPGYLVQDVDKLVGEKGRSHFIVHVVLKELEETEKIRREKEESGEEFHPYWETSAMVYAWVRASRDLDNERSMENWRDRSSP
jgi:predicted Mrr-cat superfamily restriction endonuclease